MRRTIGFSAVLIGVLLAGCSTSVQSARPDEGVRLRLYPAYDNSREWGPNYLTSPHSNTSRPVT